MRTPVFMRSLKRADADAEPPWLYGYGLAGYTAEELRRCLAHCWQRQKGTPRSSPWFWTALPTTCELSPNDPKECNIMAELHALAIEYDCPIICVIHSNEGKMAGDDARGHLGKQLARKAEIQSAIQKGYGRYHHHQREAAQGTDHGGRWRGVKVVGR